MTSASDRLELSRLVHRFGFGPKPGQYAELLGRGIPAARAQILARRPHDPGLNALVTPPFPDMGPAPSDPTASNAYWTEVYKQSISVAMWWMDRMVLADYPFEERMTWFWHGHWATSINKVSFARPMKIQNETLRKHALGNFADMSRAMVQDGALIYWLDGEENSVWSPNENLGREFMELFTLGVGHYSQNDVHQAALAFTGYQVNQTSGAATFLAKQHDYKPVSVLDKTKAFDARTLSDYIVSRPENATFIARRMWFRFISTSIEPPSSLAKVFENRDISQLITTIAKSPAMRRPGVSQAKSPVEWFVSACRALRITPSTLPSSGDVAWMLDSMGQFPFNPPSVGGWPYDEAWLTAASSQYRIDMTWYLLQHGHLEPLTSVAKGKMVEAAADWLGVPQWSTRTERSLNQALSDPVRFATLALCSPEYLVSA
ncbi:MAG TPA: DUF1800 domain-containing protein [Acidimicrobiales bacterium]